VSGLSLLWLCLDLSQEEHRQGRQIFPIAQTRQQLEHEGPDPMRMRHVDGSVGERMQDVEARLGHLLCTILLRLKNKFKKRLYE
jgi:hypothetical protein